MTAIMGSQDPKALPYAAPVSFGPGLFISLQADCANGRQKNGPDELRRASARGGNVMTDRSPPCSLAKIKFVAEVLRSTFPQAVPRAGSQHSRTMI